MTRAHLVPLRPRHAWLAPCFCLLAALVGSPQIAAQSVSTSSPPTTAWSYDYRGASVELIARPGGIAVQLRSQEMSPSDFGRVLNECGLENTNTFEPTPYPGLWVGSLDQRQGSNVVTTRAFAALASHDAVRFAAPILRWANCTLIPKPELILVTRTEAAMVQLEELLSPRAKRAFSALQPTSLFELDLGPRALFALCEELRELREVVSAQPNFILQRELFSTPNDPIFGSQWNLNNIGQQGVAGVDINALEAWEITTGLATVTVAILDEGVDVTHPDLMPNLVPGYDATNQASPAGVPGNALDFDPHGTACAGIVAAAGNNGTGSTGISWRSKIAPVRVGYASHWTEYAWGIDAITWCADNGVDILSSSWGGSPPFSPEQDAIVYAQTTGRGGLGCVVLFATGNTNNAVAHPAAYPESIAVGATSPCDERKSPSSCDGQNFWGSNFGPEIDLVAPGPFSWTTDNTGSSGYDIGDYTAFTGTSAACPHVAGATALLLSVFPNLPATQVETYLTSSADDLVGLPLEDMPGWDPFMGWGRLNARALLDMAIANAAAPISDLTCVHTGTDVELSWTNATNYDSIAVVRDSEVIATLSGTAVTYTDLAPPAGPLEYLLIATTPDNGAAPVRCFVGTLFTRGDLDASGTINLVDAVQVLNHAFLGDDLNCLDAADVDDGGSINLVDAVLLLAYVFNNGSPPAAPFPAPGHDTTPDLLDCQ